MLKNKRKQARLFVLAVIGGPALLGMLFFYGQRASLRRRTEPRLGVAAAFAKRGSGDYRSNDRSQLPRRSAGQVML